MFFVIHISSYAHRVIRQDDNGDDVNDILHTFSISNATNVNDLF